MIYKKKGSDFWYYKFKYNGRQVNLSTKQRDKQTALQLENAHRTRLAKGEADLATGDALTLKQFGVDFVKHVQTASAATPSTVNFYTRMFAKLLTFPTMANCRLDRIDENLVEQYTQHRRSTPAQRGDDTMSPAAVNRELATLRKALHLAKRWKKIRGVPKITMLKGEVVREYVLSKDLEQTYLEACPDPLRDAGALMLETGLRDGEALNLKWSDVVLEPGAGKKLGYVQIRKGKGKNAKRSVSLTERANRILSERKQNAVNDLVFPGDSLKKPFRVDSLGHQHKRVREALDLPEEFVPHSLRHTALTRLGEAGADAFTIMKIAGHSSITVSQRYVHPSNDAMEAAFQKLRCA